MMKFARPKSRLSQFLYATISFVLMTLAMRSRLLAQGSQPPKPQPDVLIFNDGEKLIGHLVRSTGALVTFKSDMAGEITVYWSKIQELQSSQTYAVIGKGVKLTKHPDTSNIPQGTVAVADQKITISPGPNQPSQTIPIDQTAHVVDQPTFQENILNNPGFFRNWTGGITAGATIVEATQKNRTYTGAVSLVRTVPFESWLDPRNRTIIDFTATYSKVTEPDTPTVKTEIYHGDAEQDEYLRDGVYLFGAATFDHNFSQGLDLQQSYGGGIGWTVFKTDKEEFDLKAGVNYIKQQFADSSQNTNLIGSTFGERYYRKLPRDIILIESLTVIPAWNVLDAYSAIGNVTLSMPLYKRFNLTLSAIDNYLNNPPIGFKKNSFQFIAGLTYTLP
jgi:hypothetical protein